MATTRDLSTTPSHRTPSLRDINTSLTDLKQQYNLTMTKADSVVAHSTQCRARLQAMKWVDRMQKCMAKVKKTADLVAAVAAHDTDGNDDPDGFDDSDLWRHAKLRLVKFIIEGV